MDTYRPELTTEALEQVLRFAPPLDTLAQADERVDAHHDVQVSLAAMDATGFTWPFDWMAEFAGREAELEDVNMVRAANLDELRKIMTAHIRINRFTEGHLDNLIKSGYWQACYDRLRELVSETEDR